MALAVALSGMPLALAVVLRCLPVLPKVLHRHVTLLTSTPMSSDAEFEFEYYRWSLLGLTGHSPDHHT